ncbi:MAG: redoxin domain-containing protein [Chloroflexi bacterium]|nr:MAG: redoxin domain-containing protein [Chloroflexota bacterium]
MTPSPPPVPPKGRSSVGTETPTLRVGMPAPDFDLPAHDGTRVSLSQLRGKRVVLAFMVHAFTAT